MREVCIDQNQQRIKRRADDSKSLMAGKENVSRRLPHASPAEGLT